MLYKAVVHLQTSTFLVTPSVRITVVFETAYETSTAYSTQGWKGAGLDDDEALN